MTESLLFELDAVRLNYSQPRRRFYQPRRETVALANVSLQLPEGQSLAIVGESGSGKSTLVRVLLGLAKPDAGVVRFRGREVAPTPGDRLLWLRRHVGAVFQDPAASLNPKMRVADIVAEPLRALNIDEPHDRRVREVLELVELPTNALERYPQQFSGGQRQRIAIARAIVHRPDVLIGDEPLSALDVMVRARLLDVFETLRRETGVQLITVTHDLGVVSQLADNISVMQSGAIVESGATAEVLRHPQHAHTRALLSAVPVLKDGQ